MTKPLKSLEGKTMLNIGYVDSWQIRDKKDVHQSHCTAVVELKELRELLDNKAKEIESELIVSFDEHQTQSGKLWILAGLLAELEVKP